MGQHMGGYYGAAYGPLGASMAAAAAAAAQQNAISVALTPNAQVKSNKNFNDTFSIVLSEGTECRAPLYIARQSATSARPTYKRKILFFCMRVRKYLALYVALESRSVVLALMPLNAFCGALPLRLIL